MNNMTSEVLHRPPPGKPPHLHSSLTLGDLKASTGGHMAGDELTPSEVATELDVSPATVRRWEARGILKPSRRLPGSRHRRYSREAVDALKKQIAEDTDAPDGA